MDLERDYSGILVPLLILAMLFSFLLLSSTNDQTIVYVDNFEIVDKKIHISNNEHKIEIIVDKKDHNNYKILINKKEVDLKISNTDELIKKLRLVNSGLMDVGIVYHFKDKSDKIENISFFFIKNYHDSVVFY